MVRTRRLWTAWLALAWLTGACVAFAAEQSNIGDGSKPCPTPCEVCPRTGCNCPIFPEFEATSFPHFSCGDDTPGVGCSRGDCGHGAPQSCGGPLCHGRMCVSLDSVRIALGVGQAPREATTPGRLELFAAQPSAGMFAPGGLVFIHPLAVRIDAVTTTGLPAGVSREVSLLGATPLPKRFRFLASESVGRDVENPASYPLRLEMTDADGVPVTDNPAQYRASFTGTPGCTVISAATGEALYYVSENGREVDRAAVGLEILRAEGGAVRQVLTPRGLVDVVTVSALRFEVRYYELAATGAKGQDGFYTVTGDPWVTYAFENPSGDPEQIDRLRLTRILPAGSDVYEFTYTDASRQWKLESGNGQRSETLSRAISDDRLDSVLTREVRDADGNVVSRTIEKRHQYAWGEALLEHSVDTGAGLLTTRYEHYTDGNDAGRYTRLRAEIDPDGGWRLRDYDALGRSTYDVRPFKDLDWDTVKNLTPGAAAALGRATVYSYTPVDPADTPLADDYRPRTTTHTVQGVAVSRTFHAYVAAPDGGRVEITEQAATPAAAYGDAGNLRTVETFYPAGEASVPSAGRLRSIAYPDGRLDTWTWEFGTWTPDEEEPGDSTFTPGEGPALRQTVTHGTVASPGGVANRTTREITVGDAEGNVVFEETQVFTGTAYERLAWTLNLYDEQGRVTVTFRSDGTHAETEWACCGKSAETLPDGTAFTYAYDDLKRLEYRVRLGYAGQPDLVTHYTYDAAGRRLTEALSGGGQSLATATEYDRAGRVVRQTAADGTVTTTGYADGGRTVSVTLPGGATRVRTQYLDGSMKSVTGTAVTPSYYDYGVNAGGTEWTRAFSGPIPQGGAFTDIPMWQKTTADFLGRTVSVEKPTYGGATVSVASSFYNALGQLARTSLTSGASRLQADTLYEYDELGDMVRSGLDVDNDGDLVLASDDRIQESETVYEQDENDDWWRTSTSAVYPTANDDTPVVTSTRRERLTGLGTAAPAPYSGVLTAESRSADIRGNVTASTTYVDRAVRTAWHVADVPTSTADSVSTAVNGLTVSSSSVTSLLTHYLYDGLGGRIGVTDPRISTYDEQTGLWANYAKTHYNALGQVDWIEDTAGNRTSYTYDATTGRRTVIENALGKKQYTAYTLRGQVYRVWGDTDYPVEYGYDAHGRMDTLRTFRGGTGWDQATRPADPGTADTTTWAYDDATGLLARKEYADGKGTDYTYDAAGRLATRAWARLVNNQPLVTTYGYAAATGELVSVDYSDATPDVSYTYDRMGRQATITDATGTRTFAYSAATLELESETLPSAFYGDAILTRQYDASGRPAGYELGTAADPDATQAVGYAYDAYGRFGQVTSSDFPVPSAVTYGYAENSDLVTTTSFPNGLVATRAYEAQRNLVDYIENKVGTTTISKYDYANDAIGRRTSVVNTGTAFASPGSAPAVVRT